jgi:hypothetical protein
MQNITFTMTAALTIASSSLQCNISLASVPFSLLCLLSRELSTPGIDRTFGNLYQLRSDSVDIERFLDVL